MTRSEQQQARVRVLKGPEVPPPPPKGATAVASILENIANNPDTTFMIEDLGEKEGWKEWSMGDLGAAAASARSWLRRRGCGAAAATAAAAGLCGPPTFLQAAFCLGAWASGMATHPLDTLSTKEELRRLLAASHVKVVYCSREEEKRLIESLGAGVETVDAAALAAEGKRPAPTPPPVSLSEIQCIAYSSGTTSHPKAVKVTSRALLFMSSLFDMDTDGLQRVLITGMPFWMSYTVVLNHCMITNKTVILPRRPDDYEDIFRILHLHKPQFWMGPPHLLLAMTGMDSPPGPVSSFKSVYVSGFALSSDKKEMIRDRVVGVDVKHWYATSEVGNITYWPGDPPNPSTNSVGYICPRTQLKVVDCKTGELLGPDSPGEIWVKTESMMAGYIGQESWLEDGGWFRTGDIGYYDKQELLYFVSRQKDVIRYLWVKIVPSELEEVLMGHPGVVEAVVGGRPHPTDGEHPAAFVLPHPDWKDSLTEAHLHAYLAERVSETKRLRGGIFFVKSIPRGSTGKVLRKKLVASVGGPSQSQPQPQSCPPAGRRPIPCPRPLLRTNIRPTSAVTN